MAETYCTAFMEDLPPEKQAEGLGVQAAVILGECFRCKDYARCSTDETFKFPADAACMVRRDMVLKEWGLEDKKDGNETSMCPLRGGDKPNKLCDVCKRTKRVPWAIT